MADSFEKTINKHFDSNAFRSIAPTIATQVQNSFPGYSVYHKTTRNGEYINANNASGIQVAHASFHTGGGMPSSAIGSQHIKTDPIYTREGERLTPTYAHGKLNYSASTVSNYYPLSGPSIQFRTAMLNSLNNHSPSFTKRKYMLRGGGFDFEIISTGTFEILVFNGKEFEVQDVFICNTIFNPMDDFDYGNIQFTTFDKTISVDELLADYNFNQDHLNEIIQSLRFNYLIGQALAINYNEFMVDDTNSKIASKSIDNTSNSVDKNSKTLLKIKIDY